MTKPLELLSVLFLFLATPAFATFEQNQDTQMIKTLIDQWILSYDQGNYTAVSQSFTADGDYINPQGVRAKGPEEIRDLIESDSRILEGQMTHSVEGLRFLSTDVALIDARCDVTSSAKEDTPSVTKRFFGTVVLRKVKEQWLIEAARIFPLLD